MYLAWAGVISASIACIIVIGAPIVERSLMYHPERTRTAPAEAGLTGVEEQIVDTADGARLVTWYAPADPGQPTLLYLHGNAGTLADRAERIGAYIEKGRGILIMAYRGYSGSTGRPSEARNVADAKLCYELLVERGVDAQDILAYGESIGSGIAVQLAADREVGGIILDSPYTSIVDVGERHYPYLPARIFMIDRYETLDEHLPKVSAPVFVIHGEQDRVIPVDMGRKIAAAAPAGGEIVTFPEAGHSDHFYYGSFEAVNGWIERNWRARRNADTSGQQKAAS